MPARPQRVKGRPNACFNFIGQHIAEAELLFQMLKGRQNQKMPYTTAANEENKLFKTIEKDECDGGRWHEEEEEDARIVCVCAINADGEIK